MKLLKKLLPLLPKSVHTSLAAREKPCEAAGSPKHVCDICLCVCTYVCREAYVECPERPGEALREVKRGPERPERAQREDKTRCVPKRPRRPRKTQRGSERKSGPERLGEA